VTPDRLTFEQYAAIDAVNFSSLKHLFVDRAGPDVPDLCVTSPYRYDYHRKHPTEPTAAMRLGRLTHTAVFEPDRLPVEYLVCCCDDRRKKEHRTCVTSAEDQGRTLVTDSDYQRALTIRDAVRANPIAAAYLRDGEAEQTIRWTDPTTGLACKGRLDWFARSPRAIVDLKTTNDIGERAFRAACERMGYFRQLAMYAMGVEACGLMVEARCVLIAVENRPPFEVAVYPVDSDSLHSARAEVEELLTVLKACREADLWPPRYTTERILRRPDWVMGEPEIAFEE
jgi:hypothetical protein